MFSFFLLGLDTTKTYFIHFCFFIVVATPIGSSDAGCFHSLSTRTSPSTFLRASFGSWSTRVNTGSHPKPHRLGFAPNVGVPALARDSAPLTASVPPSASFGTGARVSNVSSAYVPARLIPTPAPRTPSMSRERLDMLDHTAVAARAPRDGRPERFFTEMVAWSRGSRLGRALRLTVRTRVRSPESLRSKAKARPPGSRVAESRATDVSVST